MTFMSNKFPEVDLVSRNSMMNDNIVIKGFTLLAITILPGFE